MRIVYWPRIALARKLITDALASVPGTELVVAETLRQVGELKLRKPLRELFIQRFVIGDALETCAETRVASELLCIERRDQPLPEFLE